MFNDNLSISVMRECDTRRLSYEAASEMCTISPKYFGKIVRNQCNPSILYLEKLCTGFNMTPNDILRIPSADTYRTPMPVTSVQCFRLHNGRLTGFPICPRCGITIEREYQCYCDRCGQKLAWRSCKDVHIVTSGR